MISRGMSLIELLVGLAVASLIAAGAATALSIAGMAAARHSVARRQNDAAWLALAAIARDLRVAEVWTGCQGNSDCAARPAHPAASALVVSREGFANGESAWRVEWMADGDLWRCEKEQCDKYLPGVATAWFYADVLDIDCTMHRKTLTDRIRGDPLAIEIVLWMRDRRRYMRTVARPAAVMQRLRERCLHAP
ncbi:type II secretion system protein [Luteibacter flocculans]|uniref:Type II secretion system protein n=1 Tax=Luteibacter flocculans TaxID=2780091 RepID=A0ABY4T4U6_9GAMM|nr:prepilin-type N-terminal cleavage/methylation domain-containing protein [Luteibacter flocculans]URL59921.1 type II secretion system protein [Luteibacter flocculans]